MCWTLAPIYHMKDCPQCGDVVKMHEGSEGYSITCPFCGFGTIGKKTEYEANEVWNEICDIIDMRCDVVATMLAAKTDKEIDHYLKQNNVLIMIKYFEMGYDMGWEWVEFKRRVSLQLKVVDLSDEKIRKRIKAIRTGDMGV